MLEKEFGNLSFDYSKIRKSEIGTEWEPCVAPISVLKRIDEVGGVLNIREDVFLAAMAQMTIPLMKEFLSGNVARAMSDMYVLMDLLQMLYGEDVGKSEAPEEFIAGASDFLYDYIMKIFRKCPKAVVDYIRGTTETLIINKGDQESVQIKASTNT